MPPEIDVTDATPNPAPPPAPKYVTQEDLAGERTLLRDVIGRTVQESVSALVNSLRPPSAAHVEPPVDDEALATALAEGGRGAVEAARSIADRAARGATERLRREAVDPLANDGVASLAALTREAAIAKMPHYGKFKDEVDRGIAELTKTNPRAATNLDNVLGIYRYVVGMHADELIAAEREDAIRKAREPEPAPPDTRGLSREALRGARPDTPDDFFGDGAIAALSDLRNGRGREFDDFARDLGYEDGKSYMNMAKEQGWGPTGLRMQLIATDRGYILGVPTPKKAA